jgi:hypothetical protein
MSGRGSSSFTSCSRCRGSHAARSIPPPRSDSLHSPPCRRHSSGTSSRKAPSCAPPCEPSPQGTRCVKTNASFAFEFYLTFSAPCVGKTSILYTSMRNSRRRKEEKKGCMCFSPGELFALRPIQPKIKQTATLRAARVDLRRRVVVAIPWPSSGHRWRRWAVLPGGGGGSGPAASHAAVPGERS